MGRSKTKWMGAAASVVALALVGSACGSSGSSPNSSGSTANNGSSTGSASSGSGAKGTIRIGYFPDMSPLALMMGEKTLQKEGYKVTYTEFLTGMPGEAAAMVGGSIDMAWVNTAAAVAGFAKTPGTAELVGQSISNDNQVVVPKGSKITSAAQLAGKRISGAALLTAPMLVADLAMSADGKDPSSMQLVATPGPQSVTVMQQGAVSAAATYLPYGAQMALNGGRILVTADQALGSPFPGGGFVAASKFAKAHPQAVVAVLKAADAADKQLATGDSAAVATIAKFADTSTAAVAYSFKHKLVTFKPSITPDVASLTKVAGAEMKYGFVAKGTNLLPFLKTFVNSSFAQQASS